MVLKTRSIPVIFKVFFSLTNCEKRIVFPTTDQIPGRSLCRSSSLGPPVRTPLPVGNNKDVVFQAKVQQQQQPLSCFFPDLMVHLKLMLWTVTARVTGCWSCIKQHHEKHFPSLICSLFSFTFDMDLITLRICIALFFYQKRGL